MICRRGKYYYRNVRIGKRVRSEYVGAGPVAELIAQYDQIEVERRQLERIDRQQQLARLDQETAPPAELLDHARIVRDLVRAALEAAGYHQHKRGEWRRRRMQQLTDSKPTRAELLALFDKVAAEGSTAADRAELRRVIADYPDYGRAFDMANRALDSLIDGMPADKVGKAITSGRAEALRRELSGPAPSVIERLLVDQVVLSYLHVNLIEFQHGPLMGGSNASTATIEFWERRLTAAQLRYLRAIKALDDVRRRVPGVQINIADQQVNIAGEVHR